ncbi:MAG: DUF3857 domain-containing protein [Deltaproteobacteria bacterium]|nr:DUF3857 domain-containing protein [Candidatus Tharpella sp.]
MTITRQNLRKITILPFLAWALVICSTLLSFGWPATASDEAVTALTVGADAVNLKSRKHYTVASDGSYKLHIYIKRRILTYKGKKEHADFKFTYNQERQSVKLLKGQTTTTENDVVRVKTEEIHDIPAPWNSEASLYSKSRQMVVSLPAVEPGSEIEIELEVTAKVGFWCEEHFRLYDPIIDKEVIIDCPTSLALQYRTPDHLNLEFKQEKIGDKQTRYHWRGKNIPALTPERWTAPLAEQGFCLLVSSFNNWCQVTDFFNDFFKRAVTEKNERLFWPQPKTSTSTANPISHQLFRQIRDLTTYTISFQETDFKIQSPTKTRRLGYGKNCDLALLFATQLRLQNQKARILLVNHQRHFLKKFADLPYPGWWDTALVESGGEFFLFSTDKPAPGITGFDGHWALDLEKGKLVQVKDREAAMIKTELTFSTDQFPDSQGHLKLTLKGSAASSWRAQWRDLSPPEKKIGLSQLLHQINPQASSLQPLAVKGLKNDLQDLVFTCNFKIKDLFGNLAGKTSQILLPLTAPDLPLPYHTLLKNRQQPLAINDNLIIIDQITLHLSADARIIDRPLTENENLPQLQWRVDCDLDKSKKTLTYKRRLELQRGMLSTETSDYENFITSIRNLNRPEALRIIFSSTKATDKES